MNFRQLRTLGAIKHHGSFAAAADRIGLSHAAVSVQMRELEAALGAELFDRSSRPVALTADGLRIARIADEILTRLESIRRLATEGEPYTSLVIGIVPTCVQYLLPRVLSALRERYPELQVRVRSGLSGELSAAVLRRELDYALLTMPEAEISGLEVTPIAREPLYVIGPAGLAAIATDVELIRAMPYIAFNRRTWVGQHIAARLQARGIHVTESIEIDSLEAIENLVAEGFGVSIVPRRLHAPVERNRLVQIPFDNPVDTRQLVLVRPAGEIDSRLDEAVRQIFLDLDPRDR